MQANPTMDKQKTPKELIEKFNQKRYKPNIDEYRLWKEFKKKQRKDKKKKAKEKAKRYAQIYNKTNRGLQSTRSKLNVSFISKSYAAQLLNIPVINLTEELYELKKAHLDIKRSFSQLNKLLKETNHGN